MNHDTLVEEINTRQFKKGQESMATEITALRAAVESRDAEIAELNETIATAIAAIQREENWLGELLAIIHRDGGHHQVKVGTDQAVKDAHRIWADLQSQRDARIKALEDGLKQCQRTLAVLTDPSQANQSITIANVWASCVEAENRARSLLPPAQGETQ